MAKLSLADAWNETAAFLKREGRLVYPVALLFIGLPMAFAQAMMPQAAGAAGAAGVPAAGAGRWLAVSLLAAFLIVIGRVAISALTLRPGLSVGEALKRGASRAPAIVGVYLLAGLAVGLALVPLSIVLALFVPGMAAPTPDPRSAGLAVTLLLIVLLPLALFMLTRLLLVVPVAAAEEGGPIRLAKRAWRLSGPVFWPLLGFVVMSFILAFVIGFVAERVVGIPLMLLTGPARPGSVSAVVLLVVAALVGTLVQAFLTVMAARIYARVAPRESADVFG